MTDRSTERTATRSAGERPTQPPVAKESMTDTAARPGLGERITSAVGKATDEHRANADPGSKSAAKKASPGRKPPRRARLRLTRIDPWSVMKTSFLLAIAFDVVLITAIATLGAFLYNMAAALLGGVELTLAEDQR